MKHYFITGFIILFSGIIGVNAFAAPDIVGSYRCWSYNVGGAGGGNCRLFAPIVLKKNKAYSVSSEKGTYKIVDNTVILSKSKFRGPGEIIDENKLRFEYDYNGFHHVVTYLKENSATKNSKEIPVTIRVEYNREDGSLDLINAVVLVPDGQTVNDGGYQPTALGTYDGKQTVIGSFHKATNKVRTGFHYTVYTTNGFGNEEVGKLDLRKTTKKNITQTFTVTLPDYPKEGIAELAPVPEKNSSAVDTVKTNVTIVPTTQINTKILPKCNSLIPRYAQGECVD